MEREPKIAMSDDDPMAYLNAMRGKLAGLNAASEASLSAAEVASKAYDRMDRIEELLAAKPENPDKKKSASAPPAGLSADEEVMWWKNKIASLSGDMSAQDKENTNNSPDSKGVYPMEGSKAELK